MPLSNWPPWVVMWAIAAALFAGCKLLTWWATPTPQSSAWRQVAYLPVGGHDAGVGAARHACHGVPPTTVIDGGL